LDIHRGIKAKTRLNFQMTCSQSESYHLYKIARNHQELMKVAYGEYKGKRQNRK